VKVWKKNKDYKINKRFGNWWNVWYKDKLIGVALGEEQARVCIYKHNLKLTNTDVYVDEKDFDEEEDN